MTKHKKPAVFGAFKALKGQKSTTTATTTALASLALALPLCLPPSAAQADWQLVPSLELSESLTDNATLRRNRKIEDLVTTIKAGLNITRNTRRTRLHLNGSLAYDKYIDRNELDGFRPRLLGATTLDLIENHLTLDARASVAERNTFGSSLSSARGRASNTERTRVSTYSVTPRLYSRIGENHEARLRVQASGTSFSDTDVGTSLASPKDQNTVNAVATIGSAKNSGRFGWTLMGRAMENDDDFERRTIEGRIEYRINDFITPYVRIGNDDFKSPSINESDRSGDYYSLGLRLAPGPKLKIDIEAGDRFGDASAALRASYQFNENLALTVRYSEDIRTQQQSLENALRALQFTDLGGLVTDLGNGILLIDQETLLDLLDSVFKEERLRIGLNGLVGRNEVTVSAYHTAREFDTTNTDEAVAGLLVRVFRPLSSRVDGEVEFSFDKILDEQFTDNQKKNISTRISLFYDLNDTLSAEAAYNLRRQERNSGDVLENAITVSIRKTF